MHFLPNTTPGGGGGELPALPTSPRLVLAFTADIGLPGADQTAVANTINSWGADYVLDIGDNSYTGQSSDWAVWSSRIADQTYLRTRGNHTYDYSGVLANDADAFLSYMNTAGNPWWSKVLGEGLVEIFSVETGQKTDRSFAEPTYTQVGGAQYLWLDNAMKTSKALYKIVMFHQPPITSNINQLKVMPAFEDWPMLQRADLILCGHVHLSEWLNWKGTPLINLSGAVRPDGHCMVWQGSPTFMNDVDKLVGRLTITPADILVEFVNTSGSRVVFSRSIYDRSPRSAMITKWLAPAHEALAFTTVGVDALLIANEPMTIQSAVVGHHVDAGGAYGSLSLMKNTYEAILPLHPMGLTARVSGDSLRDPARRLLAGDRVDVTWNAPEIAVDGYGEEGYGYGYEGGTRPSGLYISLHCDVHA